MIKRFSSSGRGNYEDEGQDDGARSSASKTPGPPPLEREHRNLTMETFQHRAGQFFCEDVPVSSIAERFGTPTYVYSQKRILHNFERLARGFEAVPHLVCYSVKANSNLSILRLLGAAGAGFDIVSGGELARVERAGADPARIVFSGVGKTASEIDAALKAGILMFNVESAAELELIESRVRSGSHPKPAGVSVRLNPGVAAETHPYISTGQTIHKFGVPKDEAIELYRRAAASPHLDVRGVACHIGSQILAAEPFLEALEEILAVAERLRTLAIEIRFVDLGGGFGIRYADEQPLDFDRLARQIVSRLRATPYQLVVEPGRSLVGDAGILVTRVLYVKRNPMKNFVVTDAGMNDLVRPALYGSYHEIVSVEQRSGGSLRADVVGPLCETGDFLARDRDIPDVRPGDLLALLTAGAYGYALASNYNTRPRPAEVLVHGGEVELIRRRESVEELMAGEAQ
jgi:diaminopimelate decarboxylase